ncbi:MAG TPA: hypothetical protein VGT61_01805 [Thermomicrobiales bacterium]|jgi:hypothetical protein|nr:hypothetical protein [Thermomicrobiales bacterium]
MDTLADAAIRDFFSHYGATLTSGRPETIAACYVAPGLIVGDGRSTAIADVAEVAAAFDGSAERYAEQGLVGAVPDVVAIERLSDGVASVDVHWDYTDRDGNSRAEDGYRYLLAATGDGPKIRVVIATSARLRRGES